jgi:hypothetical protein
MAELVSVTLRNEEDLVITKNAIESIEWQDARSNCY